MQHAAFLAAAFLCAAPVALAGQSPLTLWLEAPAPKWDQGYGVGNGRVSGLLFGGYPKETVVLNEGSIFAKVSIRRGIDPAASLKQVRELCREGRYTEATELMTRKLLTNGAIAGSYQQGGLLDFEILNAPEKTGYRRELDMTAGKASVALSTTSGKLGWELISAPKADVTALLFSSDAPHSLAFTLRHPKFKAVPSGQELVLSGQGDGGGTKFETRVRLLPGPGAMLKTEDGRLVVTGAKRLLALVSTSTDYNLAAPDRPRTADLSQENRARLDRSARLGWSPLAAETAAHFGALLGRCSVDIGDSPADLRALPTGARLERVRRGGRDPDLQEQLFQFGRYCLVANCRPGSLPSGLQGLWNPDLNAAWMGCYFLNINCQMNYWPAETTGLPEYHRVFTDFALSLQSSGMKFAKDIGHEGFCFGHYVDSFRDTWFGGGNAELAASLMNGAWAATHVTDHYRFNGDKEYLKKSLPLLRENARFILSWFRPEGASGELLSGPGVSPEHGFHYADASGQRRFAYVSNGCAHDLLLGREALGDYLYACRELGVRENLMEKAAEALPKIPLPKIGADGRLMEWREPFEDQQKGHRHVSHCYGLFPGREFDLRRTPQHAQAVRRSLDYRLENGGGHTGWSEAWLINLYANLGDGDQADRLMNRMLSHRINPNLFDMHPPFQIDGNFGFTSGLAECLVQSRSEEDGRRVVSLAPALAKAWPTGAAKGLRARGGLVVSALRWTTSRVEADLLATRAGKFRIRHGDQARDLDLAAGAKASVSFERR